MMGSTGIEWIDDSMFFEGFLIEIECMLKRGGPRLVEARMDDDSIRHAYTLDDAQQAQSIEDDDGDCNDRSKNPSW